jgi:hypothetical protein
MTGVSFFVFLWYFSLECSHDAVTAVLRMYSSFTGAVLRMYSSFTGAVLRM